MSNPHDYTVGWICAVKAEYVAAQAFLDEEHEGPEYVAQNDNNDYTLGRIGKHNVVIAVLPNGEYGMSSAAGVARDLLHSFANVRFGLMVGIGGGGPSSRHDIRLGDVVVSTPRDGSSGVFQYDFGKTIQNQSFRPTGVLNQPPILLRTAVSGLEAKYERKGHQLERGICDILERNPRLRQKYKRPDPDTDRLYRASVIHPPNNESNCLAVCGDETSKLILRSKRTEDEDNPAIHYGLIASANQLIKDASVRDKLLAEKEILCFEMEAAGLMNHFPCLVVRGICDYSDSHKNNDWQGYAAMAAAAYTKDLLYRVAPNRVEAEKKVGDILSGLHHVSQDHLNIAKEHHEFAEEHLDIAKEQLQNQKDLAKERLSEKEQKCHQLFRLTTGSGDATYEWYKNRVEERVDGTCMWFLKHQHFQSWLRQDSGPLLVSADPGCGKSVLAKYLIDNYLPRSATICYFFFKDQDQNTARQALCALLHQLFSHKLSLIKHAMTQYSKDGQSLVNSTNSLWEVLRNAVNDPQAGPVIIVLDALDECAESEFVDLMRNVESQFRDHPSSHGKLKYLLTCRPYEKIMSKFHQLLGAFPNIRIPGEEESEAISQEVNCVITYRVNQLSEKKGLKPDIKSHLEKRLQETTHRTYLWVYLVFDLLEEDHFKKTPKGVGSLIGTLPGSVNQAYEQILNKSKELPMVRKALSIILAANRPLTLSEMNVAVSMDEKSQTIHDLDLEDDKDFKSRLRSCCGLFVSINYSKVYFLHQTAREFLLADLALPIAVPSELRWHHSITTSHAHTVLAEICVLYLNLFNFDASLRIEADGKASHSVDSHAFLDYSTKTWAAHFRQGSIVDGAAIVPSALKICDPDSRSYSIWFRAYWQTQHPSTPAPYFTDLMVASYLGLNAVVKLLVQQGADVQAKDSPFGQTALLWAAGKGHETVVWLLLDQGAHIESKNKKYGRTPLIKAANKGHMSVVKLLLDKGANIESMDNYGQTPLSNAAAKGRKAVVRLLLENGANIESKDKYGQTPLSNAAAERRMAVVRLLVADGAHIDGRDNGGRTPLSYVAQHGDEAVMQLLLDKGANVESKDKQHDRTPLAYAAANGCMAAVCVLLDNGAHIDERDNGGRTPLSYVVQNGDETVVRLLLNKGANVKSTDNYGRAPLSYAAAKGRETIVQLLLDKGASIDAKDNYGQTPLLRATNADRWPEKERMAVVVRLLLKNRARFNERDSGGRTPMSYAAEDGDEMVVRLLLNKGANKDERDNSGRTPLSYAAATGRKDVTCLLLKNGANVKLKDKKHGRTPLSYAAEDGDETVVRLLLNEGANNIDESDNNGRTPLSYAAKGGNETVVQLLLNEGANIDESDNSDRTPLSYAAEDGDEKVVRLLLDNGADIKFKEKKHGRTPLFYAAAQRCHSAVGTLLNRGANIDERDNAGRTPLSYAAAQWRNSAVGLLINEGANIDERDNGGRTPLSYAAAQHGNFALGILLNSGANIDERDNGGRTPLSYAAEGGSEKVVKLLLDKGAHIESRDNSGWAPLSYAAEGRNETVIRLLLDKGANVKFRDKKHGRTPLSYAAEGGDETAVRLLLNKVANIDERDNGGRTPLLYAAEGRNETVIRLLLDKGANIEAKDQKNGQTPLSCAAAKGRTTVIEVLLDNGANIEAKDNDGRTPLSHAAAQGRNSAVRLLLREGADTELADKDDQTPLLLAAANRHWLVVKLLLGKGSLDLCHQDASETDSQYSSLYYYSSPPTSSYLSPSQHSV